MFSDDFVHSSSSKNTNLKSKLLTIIILLVVNTNRHVIFDKLQ